jgi:hypothetical protein
MDICTSTMTAPSDREGNRHPSVVSVSASDSATVVGRVGVFSTVTVHTSDSAKVHIHKLGINRLRNEIPPKPSLAIRHPELFFRLRSKDD